MHLCLGCQLHAGSNNPNSFVYFPFERLHKTSTHHLPYAHSSHLLPFQSTNEGVCVHMHAGTHPLAISAVFCRVHSDCTSVILTCSLDSVAACIYPNAQEQMPDIKVNPLICLVYTNALIWQGVPSTVAWDHNSNLCPVHEKTVSSV